MFRQLCCSVKQLVAPLQAGASRTHAERPTGVHPEPRRQLARRSTTRAGSPWLAEGRAHFQRMAPRAGTWEANALVVASIEEAVRVAREGGRLDLAKLATFAAPQAER